MSDNPQDRLAALGQATQETDQANPDPAQAAEQERAERQADEAEQGAKDWGMLPFMIGGLAAMIEPELRQVYSEERCLIWGKSAHQVAQKYGWDSPSNMPELALFTSTVTFAIPTFFMVRAKLAEMKEGKASGLLAKVGLWWRARKAAKEAASKPKEEGQGGGGQ